MTTKLPNIYVNDTQLFRVSVYDEGGTTLVTPLSCSCSIWNDATNAEIVDEAAGTVGTGYAQYNWSGSASAGKFKALLTTQISAGVTKSELFYVTVLATPPSLTSLVSPNDVRPLVNTGLTDDELQVVIDRIEADITARIGAPQTDAYTTTLTKTLRGEGPHLFMPTEIYAVVSITEDGAALAAGDYQTWAAGVIERLPSDSNWGDRNVVVYKPVDDRLRRTQVIIDLARIVLERTAMKSEDIAGEYSFEAPDDWDAEFRKAIKRLQFKAI
jgi:hypothetical protein